MSASHKGPSRLISKFTKDKSFSSKGKIEKYNRDGTETIIVMGRPFRVMQKIGEEDHQATSSKRRGRKESKETRSYVFLVENTENLPEFPRHLALKRSFFNVNELLLAHREPDVLGRVKDKNIVNVFHSEVTRSDGKIGVTVAMEYCSNNLYRRLMQDTRLTEGEIVQILLAVTSAVGYLHSQQPPIAHRDIRPDCILIHSNFPDAASYRLCNFGGATTEAYQCANREEVALAMEDIERHTTTAFRAPEMMDPSSGQRIDERVDLWSIGVLLYYMMYLQFPFGETVLGLTGRPKLRFPAGTEMRYTSSLRVVLIHLLEPDPEKRWDIFALTNFLRFDEEISRHIGTFFFTVTEWPDGWEQQDVKVVNRPVPPKAPPVRVKTMKDDVPRQVETDAHMNTQLPRLEQLDTAALAALGIDINTKDPEMRAYYEMILREQEEAWQKAKETTKNIKLNENETTIVKDNPPQDEKQQKEDMPVEEKKKNDIFDDLFEATPIPLSSSSTVAFISPSIPIPSSSATAFAQPVTSPNVVLNGDNWKDSLFTNYAVPSQSQRHESYDMMIQNGWESGVPTMAPTMVASRHSAGEIPYGPQATLPPPPQSLSSSSFLTPHPQQQEQEQQATLDFMQGSIPPPAPVQSNREKKKDPFEDLFLK